MLNVMASMVCNCDRRKPFPDGTMPEYHATMADASRAWLAHRLREATDAEDAARVGYDLSHNGAQLFFAVHGPLGHILSVTAAKADDGQAPPPGQSTTT